MCLKKTYIWFPTYIAHFSTTATRHFVASITFHEACHTSMTSAYFSFRHLLFTTIVIPAVIQLNSVIVFRRCCPKLAFNYPLCVCVCVCVFCNLLLKFVEDYQKVITLSRNLFCYDLNSCINYHLRMWKGNVFSRV